MAKWLGAQQPLASQIDKHLFLIAPNNSGSTFVKNVLSTCANTWNLKREGQWMFGYRGPTAGSVGLPLIWASSPDAVRTLQDQGSYDFETIKRSWYFQSFSKSKNASVFTTKAPPFLLIVDMLQENFKNTHFIFMVRDPYAVVEGICRRTMRYDKEKAYITAAKHIMTCFAYQKKNIERFKDNAVFFTYEQMCRDPENIEQQIKYLFPELLDIVLRQKLPVKGLYNEELRNMNNDQIARLMPEDLQQINMVFKQHKDLMSYFGYPLRNA